MAAQALARIGGLYAWLHEQLSKVAKKSEFALAIRYALSRWTALMRYRDDGRSEIDNNPAERSLRAVALGRKNWLFAGCDDGGKGAAGIDSLLGTAHLHGLNNEAYLRHLFERLPEHPINRIEELLPWQVADQPEKQSPERRHVLTGSSGNCRQCTSRFRAALYFP